MQHQATQPTGLVKYVAPQNLAPANVAPKSLAPRHEAPLLKRFLGKLVVDVLPATFVSVLGGFIIAQYQLNHASASHPATEQVVPASAEMMQLVRDEHAVIIDYLKTQMAAEKNRHAAEDAAVADARLAAAEPQAPAAAPIPASRPVATAVAAKPVPARTKVAAAPVLPPHAPLLIAQTDQPASATPAADPAPESKSLLTRTIEIKDHVVGATLHAVSAIGSIPSWIASMGGGSGTTSSSAGRMFSTSL
ncbi:MAG TPA: hypothetical protein VK749_19700 [Xanthobacteraceae bacterium]|jgi:hypothetical protein|nr:hypothetical protein [Xanthobacteraceae bacterium]